MSTFSKTTIVGNLGDDPVTRHFEGGGMVTNISVATTETWKDKTTGEKKELTEWHRCTATGKTAELIDKYLSKGQKVLIEGQNRTRKWTDDKGVDRYSTEVRIREIVFLSPKNATGGQGGTNDGSAVNQYNANANREPHAGDAFLAMGNDGDADDLPF